MMISSCCEQIRDWKSLKINDEVYMICLTIEDKSRKILLTNLIEIWVETLTDETIFRRCQTLNPLLTLEAFDWRELVMDMLNDIPKHTRKCAAEASAYRIELQREKDFIRLKFALDLAKGTPHQFSDNVTMPLCLSSMELIRQREILLDLVKRKDEEIMEYKAEGAELIRKYIATKPFSKELLDVDAAAPSATDFVKAFQSVYHFYNAMNLSSSRDVNEMKTELEASSNTASNNNTCKIDKGILSESSMSESVQMSKQKDTDKNAQTHSKIEECEDEAVPSTSKISIFRLSNASHSIQKSLKKNKKTLSDFIL